MTRPVHPAAEIFPAMTGAEFDALVADIKEHGLREPIVLVDGAILDGRNRARACEQLGISPMTREWDREGTPEAFVISHNLHRRHLNVSQRAMIAGRIADLHGGLNQYSKEVWQNHHTTSRKAGEMLNVARKSVSDARTVQAEGTAEEIAAVTSGDATVSKTAKAVRARRPPKPPKPKSGKKLPPIQTGKNPDRVQRMRENGELWRQVRSALDALTGLPLPEDVVEIVRQVDRYGITDEKLVRAVRWLTAFQTAWETSKEKQNGRVSRVA